MPLRRERPNVSVQYMPGKGVKVYRVLLLSGNCACLFKECVNTVQGCFFHAVQISQALSRDSRDYLYVHFSCGLPIPVCRTPFLMAPSCQKVGIEERRSAGARVGLKVI